MESKDIKISVHIPFGPGGKLGHACNEIMIREDGWVLLLDHDVIPSINPNWYSICQQAIIKNPGAGLFSCFTNRIGCPYQKYPIMMDTDDLNQHIEIAKKIYREEKGNYQDLTDCNRPFSGFFFLTHKDIWNECGRFAERFLGMDTNYFGKVKQHGFRIILIRELYCFHLYRRFWKTGAFDK